MLEERRTQSLESQFRTHAEMPRAKAAVRAAAFCAKVQSQTEGDDEDILMSEFP
jgi:hypothetical protein